MHSKNFADVGLSMLGGGLLNGLAKGAFKFKTVGSHTWSATRKWMTKNNIMVNKPNIQRHHWLFEQNQGIGKYVPDFIKNQPWNINPISTSFNIYSDEIGESTFGKSNSYEVESVVKCNPFNLCLSK